MTLKSLRAAVFAALIMAPGAALAAPLSYDLDPFTFDVSGSSFGLFDGIYDITGTIVTDGTIGVLTASNIVSGSATAVRRTDMNSVTVTSDTVESGIITLTDVEVSATATQIILDFEEGGEVRFSEGANSFGFRQGSIIAFVEIPQFGISAATQISNLNRAGIANVPAPPSAVPLPPAAALLVAGLGALGLARRRNKSTLRQNLPQPS